jgi:outer membrane protein OmpA-like peptidoglycan-associated protein
MKKSIGLFLVVYGFLSQPLLAQADLDLADRYYQNSQFFKAALLYEDAYAADTLNTYAAFKLAESYRKLFQYNRAEEYYRVVYRNDNPTFPQTTFYLGQMLKYNGKFEEAIRYFNQFLSLPRKLKKKVNNYLQLEQQAAVERSGCYFAMEFTGEDDQYRLEKLPEPLNTRYNDYGPAIGYDDSVLAVTSGRLEAKGGLLDNRYGEAQPDNFLFRQKAGQWENITDKNNFNLVNSRWGDGAGTFTRDMQRFYFTSCNPKAGGCKIMVSVKQQGKWTEPFPLNSQVNARDYETKHPTLTPGGDTLLFVSDRPGGSGGNDIWMSIRGGNGESWGPPRNLGDIINTSGNEISPYFSAGSEELYFASDGQRGFGGMDVFVAQTPFRSPEIQNMGQPVNSSRDDCYYVSDAGKTFFASNRATTHFDIFALYPRAKQPPEPPGRQVANRMLENNRTLSFNEKSMAPMLADAIINRVNINELLGDGSARFILSSNLEQYSRIDQSTVNAVNSVAPPSANRNKMLQQQIVPIDPPMEEVIIEHNNTTARQTDGSSRFLLGTYISQIQEQTNGSAITGVSSVPVTVSDFPEDQSVTIKGILYDNKLNAPVQNVSVPLTDTDNVPLKIAKTNPEGFFQFVGINHANGYKLIIPNENSARYEIRELTVSTEKINAVPYENVYFNFNEFQLRKEGQAVLDDLVAFCKKNSVKQIDITAYTDTVGTNRYNLELSRKRGQEVFNYLVEAGIDPSRIVIDARGKAERLVSSNFKVSQQLNRRVEFSLKGQQLRYEPEYQTLIIRPGATLYSLARYCGLTVEELKKINNLTERDTIEAYHPIRVKKLNREPNPGLFFNNREGPEN